MEDIHREFIGKLKANGTDTDLSDLMKVHSTCKALLCKLSAKDRGCFALNVLCILCRNLDKVPIWRDRIDNKALLTLTIDCVRETRGLGQPDQVKTLACIYHIHKHVVKQASPISPELVLKLSMMPFECDPKNLLTEYCKTYWSILVDRMTYLDQLKNGKIAIVKLLPKLTEDILKVIEIFDTVQFCTTALTFLIKKIHFLYSDRYHSELNKVFGDIFEKISSKKDHSAFKKLKDVDILDLYIKFNDCLYVVIENASKCNFKDSILNSVVRNFISLIGHSPDMFHCFQTFYSNSLNNLFTNTTNCNYLESIFNSLLLSCETTEKLGYTRAMYATYPYINQLLKLYIEYTVNNNKWSDFTEQMQVYFLKLIILLMKKSRKCKQILKCENCNVKTGLHDALRLSFLAKHFIIIPINENLNINNILPIYNTLIEDQHNILKELCNLKCCNYEKCFRKLQTDVHNTAIILNKSAHFEYSIIFFTIYLKYEMRNFKDEADLKNISRALYNKSICELDCKLYEVALKNAFLSLIFAHPDGLSSDKHMSLVMDIKAKSYKANEESEDQDGVQLMSVLEACKLCLDSCEYGNLKPFLIPLRFSHLLKHEFEMYLKLWPSILPVAGVWRSLNELLETKHVSWLKAENEDDLLWTLCEVVLETPTAIRTIHSEHYSKIVTELLDRFDKAVDLTPQFKVVHASLMFLKAEYDLNKASEDHRWKDTEACMDPDLATINRTIPQEYEATRRAIHAVDLWLEILPQLDTVPVSKYIVHALQIAQVFVQQLLHLSRDVHGMQLAYICCCIAKHVDDKPSYIRNAGTLLYHADKQTDELARIATTASQYCRDLAKGEREAAIVFICEAAIYYAKSGQLGTSAKLVQLAQAQILTEYQHSEDVNLDLAVGRLMEAQCLLCRDTGPSSLSAVNGIQRHYLAINNTETKWTSRRLFALTVKHSLSAASCASVRLCAALLLLRRARSACAVALRPSAAVDCGTLLAGVSHVQIKIDNRLNHILGLEASNDPQPAQIEPEKLPTFTPKQDIETMLENMTFKKTQISPSLPCLSVPAFKIPEILKHKKCDCYACQIPTTCILICLSSGLEAAMYFRAKEVDIARNYFDGALKCLKLTEAKLMEYIKYCSKYEEFIVDIVERKLIKEFRNAEVKILIEASLFELSENNYEKSDEYIVRIHEIQDMVEVDAYLKNEVLNVMVTSAQLRRVVKYENLSLETEFESIKLTPTKNITIEAKTPETKPEKPPKFTNIVVKDEELPKKRGKVIEFKLDSATDEADLPKKATKKSEFKIPVPVTSKHVLENITPRNTRSRPGIIISQPSEDRTSKTDSFFTPTAPTPDQFFTPISTIKTYSKKSLRQNIVKNLEAEFSTPKSDKENLTEKVPVEVPKTARTRLKIDQPKKSLRRATSPGKLSAGSSRGRQVTKFRVHEDDKAPK